MPFPGGIEAIPNGTLILSAVAAFLYLVLVGEPSSWRRTFAKTASTGLLGGLVLVENGPPLLAAALFLSALGDLLLAEDGDRAFLAGLGAFLVAHLVYVVLFALAGGGPSILWGDPVRLAAGIAMVLLSLATVARLMPALPPGLSAPVAAYGIAILAMGLTALTLPAPAVLVGAILFMASDALLAAGRFLLAVDSPRQALVRPAVWSLYYLGQAAITLGVLLA
jgi:uncharacterized membrane protein YhhN